MKPEIIVLFDIDNTLFNTIQFKKSDHSLFEAYKEVKETLEQLSKIAKLGILSQGEVAFQQKKLEEANIARYFFEEHTHIVQYKLEMMQEVFRKYKKNSRLYYIDDWLDSLRIAKKTAPTVFTIWMKRGEYAHLQEEHLDFTPDAVVANLREVIKLVKDR